MSRSRTEKGEANKKARDNKRREKRRFEPLPKPPTRNQIHELLPEIDDEDGSPNDFDVIGR